LHNATFRFFDQICLGPPPKSAGPTRRQYGCDCAQTKSQYDYFCTKKGDPAKDDIMTTANIACNYAKRNMAAACDGNSEKDAAYKFDEQGAPAAK